jgi:GNAT superfamily N-acetyltransferase
MSIHENQLVATVDCDEIVMRCAQAFDFAFQGTSTFDVPRFTLPDGFQVGLIVGPSGTGKSTLLKRIGQEESINWDERKAVCSHFNSAEDAQERLGAVGLNSIPAWMRPYHVLSTGEKFRADLARRLRSGAVIDEFTSVVDRNVAKSCAFAAARYIRNVGLQKVVFATCHYDEIDWLQPDWVFDTATSRLTGRGSERRPTIKLEVVPATVAAWSLFRNHHYLSADINRSARCWVAVWNDVPVGFASILAFPSGSIRNGWREHRTVVLPEFQGMGLGVRISDAIGTIVKQSGGRFFSKTASWRMGAYRNQSALWKPTSKNGKARPDYAAQNKTKESGYRHRHIKRLCFSHEFVGTDQSIKEKLKEKNCDQ